MRWTKNLAPWVLAVCTGLAAPAAEAAGPRIGAAVSDVDATQPGGVLIKEVQQGASADRAGLRPGDVVVELDGERVRSAAQFARLVEESVPGREVRAIVLREGRRVELRLVPASAEPGGPGAMPYDLVPGMPGPSSVPGPAAGHGRLGLQVQPLTPQLAAYFGAQEGVLVATVPPGSPGAHAGLAAGDVITAVNDHPVREPRDLVQEVQAASAAASPGVSLTIL